MKNKLKAKNIPLSTLEKNTLIMLFSIITLYAIFITYLLNTPINEWVLNLGQYNQQLLELFPKAQNWINNSPAFRDRLIPVYVLHHSLKWLILTMTTIVMIYSYKYYKDIYINKGKAPTNLGCSIKNFIIIFAVIFFFLYAVLFITGKGSEIYKLYSDLNYDSYLFSNDERFNIVYVFIISYVYVPSICVMFGIFGIFRTIYQIIFCLKQKRNK